MNEHFRALRHRDFRLFVSGQVISLMGTWMQSVAQSWLVYRLTQSTVWMGTLGFCNHIPVLLLGPIAGLAADRFNRRRIVTVAQCAFLVQALTLAALTLSERVTIGWLIPLAALWGVINAFEIPARQSMYIHLVGKEDLLNAIALNSMTFNAARVVGPSIGGFFVAAFGEGTCFLVNGISYLAVIWSLFSMSSGEPARSGTAAFAKHLREGFAYAWTHPGVRTLLGITALANLSTTPVSVLAPVFADRIFHRGSEGLGLLLGAMGAGAIVGTVVLARLRGTSALAGVILRSAIQSSLSLALFALSPWFGLSLMAMALMGFGIFRMLSAINTTIQSTIEDDYRGRIMSLYTMTVVGMLPLGSLAGGAAAEWIGVRQTLLASSLLGLAAALLWAWKQPAVTNAENKGTLAV
ncbi:MAG: MFS transporter [Bryobacteraceae bacterium]